MNNSNAVEWNESTRQLASDNLQMTMQKRWRTRPKRDVETLRLGLRVANAAAVEDSYQPAAENVRVVKAAFATAGFAAKSQEKDGPIELLFDSFSQPPRAGTRSAATRVRQMLYRVEPYQIDLQIEFEPETNCLIVTGQLLDVSHPEMVGRDVQVMLSDGHEYIVNTVTNQFGEFSSEVKNSGDLEVSFLGRSKKPIIILLRSVLD
jgi:hypothetical protein